MASASEILMGSTFFGLLSGGIAGVVTYGGRCISKVPQLPYQSAASTAGGFGVAMLVVMSAKGKLISEENDTDGLGILLGGAVLATAANKMWVGRNLSLLSNAATPTITMLSLLIICMAMSS